MKNLPTDFEILNAIYERYYDTFTSFSRQEPDRNTKILVPIDIGALSRDMGVDPDIIFGRFYYDLDARYRYRQPDGTSVSLFVRQIQDGHCVNFPYIASILSRLREENRKFRIATTVAVVSLIIAVLSLGVSVTTSFLRGDAEGPTGQVTPAALESSSGARTAAHVPWATFLNARWPASGG